MRWLILVAMSLALGSCNGQRSCSPYTQAQKRQLVEDAIARWQRRPLLPSTETTKRSDLFRCCRVITPRTTPTVYETIGESRVEYIVDVTWRNVSSSFEGYSVYYDKCGNFINTQGG